MADERSWRRTVGTRDEATVDAACDAVAGEETVVELAERRTLVIGPLNAEDVRDLGADTESTTWNATSPSRPPTPSRRARNPRGRPGASSASTRRPPAGGLSGRWRAGRRGRQRGDPHPDQAPNGGEGIAFVDCEGDCEAPWHDDAGHGTACAGIVCDTGGRRHARGGARGHAAPMKVLDAANTGRGSLVVEGLRRAVSRAARSRT